MSDRADLKSTEPYAARAVRPMGTETFGGGWRLKVYGIAYRGEEPRRELIQAGLGASESVLPRPALSNTRYGLGFLGIHEGRDSNFVFVCWWENENELQHRVFYSAPGRPGQLRAATPAEPIACIWDLSVIEHERKAWIRHVLVSPAEADADGYLLDVLSGNI